MKALCRKCGHPWNVSVHKKIGKQGYTCPHCTRKSKRIQKIALFITGFVISFLIVPICSELAYLQRGYRAYGGEILIPVLYLSLVGLIRELSDISIKKAPIKECKHKNFQLHNTGFNNISQEASHVRA